MVNDFRKEELEKAEEKVKKNFQFYLGLAYK